MEQYECQLLQTFCVKFVKKDTTSTNVRNIRKMRNFQGKKNPEKIKGIGERKKSVLQLFKGRSIQNQM